MKSLITACLLDSPSECGQFLRDVYAGRAMQVLLARYLERAEQNGWDCDWREGVARDAYAIADAMIDVGKEG